MEDNLYDTIKKSGNGLYDFIANNYTNLSRYDLEEIALNAIFVADNDDKIKEEMKDRIDEDDYELLKDESLYGYVANNYYDMYLPTLKEIALNAVYVADNDEAILKEIKDRLTESEEVTNLYTYKRGIEFETDFDPDLDYDTSTIVDNIDMILEDKLPEFKEEHKEDYSVNFGITDISDVTLDADYLYITIKAKDIVDVANVNEIFNDIHSEIDLSTTIEVSGEQDVDSWDPSSDYGYVSSSEYIESEGEVSVSYTESICSLE